MVKIVTFGCERLYRGMKILIVEENGMIFSFHYKMSLIFLYKISFFIKIYKIFL